MKPNELPSKNTFQNCLNKVFQTIPRQNNFSAILIMMIKLLLRHVFFKIYGSSALNMSLSMYLHSPVISQSPFNEWQPGWHVVPKGTEKNVTLIKCKELPISSKHLLCNCQYIFYFCTSTYKGYLILQIVKCNYFWYAGWWDMAEWISWFIYTFF